MSRKSRQPKGSAEEAEETKGRKRKGKDKDNAGGKRGKKGKGADRHAGRRTVVVTHEPEGVPFSFVVLFATVLSLPSISKHVEGGLAFDALMVRVFLALAVAWLLSNLVYAVFDSMRPKEVAAVVELTPEEAFDALAAQGGTVPLTGTVLDDEDDPFAVPPATEPEPLAPLEPLDTVDPLALPASDEPAA